MTYEPRTLRFLVDVVGTDAGAGAGGPVDRDRCPDTRRSRVHPAWRRRYAARRSHKQRGRLTLSVVDVHSHVTPPSFREAVLDGGTWHTLTNAIGELEIPEFSIAPKDRIAKMDAAGIDMHVLTVNNDFYRYELDPGPTQEIARACNEEIGQMMADHPDRFTGLATVPMQDIERAVAEMEYAMSKLGYRGITINDHVNGVTFDEPRFYPFWELWNPLARWCSSASAGRRWSRRAPPAMRCPNSIGNLVDRAVTFGTLVFGGIMDRYPELKICLGHAGGYAPFGVARMDKTWRAADPEVPEFADARLPKPPSEYLNRFYYDSCTYTESTLRFLIDAVGIDRVGSARTIPPRWCRGGSGRLAGKTGWHHRCRAHRDIGDQPGTHARPVAACPPTVRWEVLLRGGRRRAARMSRPCCAAMRPASLVSARPSSSRIGSSSSSSGASTFADIEVGLSYPRLQSDPAVSTVQSEILAVFEEMESRRASHDPRIAARAEGESSTA